MQLSARNKINARVTSITHGEATANVERVNDAPRALAREEDPGSPSAG